MSETTVRYIVQGTMVLLVLSSALAWAIFILKSVHLARLARENRRFADAVPLRTSLPARKEVAASVGPVARLALVGLDAWGDARTTADTLDVRKDVLERSLHQQTRRERRALESGLTVLASIGSTSPFVGLFGTVFGIIAALTSISRSGSASLDVVAGPIGEALVATGVGIAVAVPAVLAYNFFGRAVKTIVADLDDYASSFVNVALRGAIGADAPGRAATGREEDVVHRAITASEARG